MGKSTISMAIFNSYVKLPEGTVYEQHRKGTSNAPQSQIFPDSLSQSDMTIDTKHPKWRFIAGKTWENQL
jgi:hypothetical protein